jgi:hypothetical protein
MVRRRAFGDDRSLSDSDKRNDRAAGASADKTDQQPRLLRRNTIYRYRPSGVISAHEPHEELAVQ